MNKENVGMNWQMVDNDDMDNGFQKSRKNNLDDGGRKMKKWKNGKSRRPDKREKWGGW